MSKDPLSPSVFRLLNEVGIIEQLARNQVEKRLPYGLKISQFSLLNHFVRLGGDWTPSRLAAAFQVTKAAMTNTVGRLDKLGFVEVVPSEQDARSKLVRITDTGRSAHLECLTSIGPALTQLQEAFGSKAFDEALPFLENLRVYLDENR